MELKSVRECGTKSEIEFGLGSAIETEIRTMTEIGTADMCNRGLGLNLKWELVRNQV